MAVVTDKKPTQTKPARRKQTVREPQRAKPIVLALRLDQATYDALVVIADGSESSIAEVGRTALIDYLNHWIGTAGRHKGVGLVTALADDPSIADEAWLRFKPSGVDTP